LAFQPLKLNSYAALPSIFMPCLLGAKPFLAISLPLVHTAMEPATVRRGPSHLNHIVKGSEIGLPVLAGSQSLACARQDKARMVQRTLGPNPSIERTSTGLARFTPLVYVPLRGPSRWLPAHVKR
jgi:hypothetical protein